MIRLFLNVSALFCLVLALGLMWQDFVSDTPSVLLGQIWFELSPQSLQVSEAVIERYVDPCGLITALGCSPFLWHPLISSVLQWPAVIVFGILAILLSLLARFFAPMRNSKRRYTRERF